MFEGEGCNPSLQQGLVCLAVPGEDKACLHLASTASSGHMPERVAMSDVSSHEIWTGSVQGFIENLLLKCLFYKDYLWVMSLCPIRLWKGPAGLVLSDAQAEVWEKGPEHLRVFPCCLGPLCDMEQASSLKAQDSSAASLWWVVCSSWETPPWKSSGQQGSKYLASRESLSRGLWFKDSWERGGASAEDCSSEMFIYQNHSV